MSHTLRQAWLAWLPLLVLAQLGAAGPGAAQPTLPAGAIAFVHEDSGSTDPLQQVSNLRLLDAQDPAHQVVLTAFATAPTLLENPAWSRDFATVAFASNFANGLRSLEEESVYAIGVDGTGLRVLTGFGTIADLPGPTGVVTGRVVGQTLKIGVRTVSPTVTGCLVSAQGASVTAACENDGSFRLSGVPVGSGWLRAQASVDYFDAVLGIYGGPGLSFGFTTIDVKAGQTTNAGTIVITPAIEKSIYPSFAPGDGRLLASDRVRAMVLQQNPDTYAWEWNPTRGGTLVVWDLVGGTGPKAIVLPGTADVADLSGGDWSPVAERIACAAGGTIGGKSGSFVLLIDPAGSNPTLVYQSPLGPFDPAIRLVLQARWSPDGQRLAVVESATSVYDITAGRSDILVMDADGSNVHAVTASAWGEYAGSPSWSPDGQVLAYHVAIMPSLLTMVVERSDLFAVPAAGGAAVQLTSDGRSSQPAWRTGGLPNLPPPCSADAECDDADACTTDRCRGGTCVSQSIGGFEGARCAIDHLGSALCDPGVVSGALQRFIDRQVARAEHALDAAAATDRAKRRGKLVQAADRRLAAVARRVTKLGRAKKHPLDAVCRDRILGEVTQARGVVAGLGA